MPPRLLLLPAKGPTGETMVARHGGGWEAPIELAAPPTIRATTMAFVSEEDRHRAALQNGDAVADGVRTILAYHERTKHHLSRYAAGPGYLDWASQPDPFRSYAGAPLTRLPLVEGELPPTHDALHDAGAIAPHAVDLAGIATLLELSLGLSAWKEHGSSRWALRCNPSSGNLHPTEAYLVTPGAPGLEPGVHHYVSRDHLLEHRCALSGQVAGDLASTLGEDSFVIVLSSIHWRESWKYGERAFRYCQHDAGHALAALRYAAAALGWHARLLDEAGDAALATLSGLDRSSDFSGLDPLDAEHPDTAVIFSPSTATLPHRATAFLERLPALLARMAAEGRWHGAPNPLSPTHTDWPIIDSAANASRRPPTPPAPPLEPAPLPPMRSTSLEPASRLIRQRRSAVQFDGVTSLSAPQLFALLDRLLPRAGIPPWDLWPWPPAIHLGLFVHRVDGLPPGLYALERDPAVHGRLAAALAPRFAWTRPAGCPEHLRLFLLEQADARGTARTVSCHQEIAADGALSLGMLAELPALVRERGAWWWRRLFWEAGILGQALYLEAEAAGVRGTGIGCYFDDAFHEVLGIHDGAFQSLYHFTLGGPVDDPRLRTRPPYIDRKS